MANYDVQLGPLRFVTPLDQVGEQLGDGLEVVGSAIVAGERRARPFKVKLPVYGARQETNVKAAGLRLRRQVRQMLENPRWRSGGLYFTWAADTEVSAWLMVGGGDLSESQAGVSFGDFELELSDVYVVGRPGTHKPARRLDLADRRGGIVPRDTRGLLFSTDFSTQPLPAEPLILPGSVVSVTGAGGRSMHTTVPLSFGGKSYSRSVIAVNGEAVSYLPASNVFPNAATAYNELDEIGACRLWDLSAAATYPPTVAGYTAAGDLDPTLYGWEQMFGEPLQATQPLALDNGACRIIWLGPTNAGGYAVEHFDTTTGKFIRTTRVLNALGMVEHTVVEAGPERVVIEARGADKAMRVILQRGWWGPRFESYNDSGGTALLEYAMQGASATPVIANSSPTWVKVITATTAIPLKIAPGTSTDVIDTSAPTVLTGAFAFRQQRARVAVAQLVPSTFVTGADVASLSLVDARNVPVLTARARA